MAPLSFSDMLDGRRCWFGWRLKTLDRLLSDLM